MDRERNDDGKYAQEVSNTDVVNAMKSIRGPAITTGDIAHHCDCSRDTARTRLSELESAGRVERRDAPAVTLWWLR